jgi:cell division septation protein DedD
MAAAPHPGQGNTPAAGQLYLQVGAFTDHNNASQLLNRLVAATTENVLINRKAEGKENIYRVRIGPLDSEADAQQLQTQLGPQFDRLGIDAAHMVVE